MSLDNVIIIFGCFCVNEGALAKLAFDQDNSRIGEKIFHETGGQSLKDSKNKTHDLIQKKPFQSEKLLIGLFLNHFQFPCKWESTQRGKYTDTRENSQT